MPVANKDFGAEPFWTRFFLSMFYGGNPDYWSETAHRNTGWEFWKQPDGEMVPVWKDRTLVGASIKDSFEFPTSTFVDIATNKSYVVDTTKDVFKHSSSLWMGSYNGEPMQYAKVENGILITRSVSYGYPWFQNQYANVPLPASGRYEHCGGPNVASDRHVCIFDPVTREVHELIQFDEHAPDTPVTNQALGWGVWKDGVLVEGDSVTATETAISSVIWDRNSRNAPHRLGMVLSDYVGADGTLTNGPEAGGIFYLPSESESYKAMFALGGECAALAKAASDYGIKLFDRSGYGSETINNGAPVRKTKTPTIVTQWGAWNRTTNLDKLHIRLHDLRGIR